jgi:hypothetical protein
VSALSPLGSTRLSRMFQKTAALNGFHTLEQLLSIKLTNLLKMDWFILPMIEEIAFTVKMLRKKGKTAARTKNPLKESFFNWTEQQVDSIFSFRFSSPHPIDKSDYFSNLSILPKKYIY